MHFKILPNKSQSSYDTHLFDLPTSLETDITIIFSKKTTYSKNIKETSEINNDEHTINWIKQK